MAKKKVLYTATFRVYPSIEQAIIPYAEDDEPIEVFEVRSIGYYMRANAVIKVENPNKPKKKTKKGDTHVN